MSQLVNPRNLTHDIVIAVYLRKSATIVIFVAPQIILREIALNDLNARKRETEGGCARGTGSSLR